MERKALLSNALFVAILVFVISIFGSQQALANNDYSKEITGRGDITEFRGCSRDDSGPIPVLTLAGDPYERGLAYGVLMRAEIVAVSQTAEEYFGNTAKYRYRKFIHRAYLAIQEWLHSVSFKKRSPQPYLEEIHGLAEGSGVSFAKLLDLSSGYRLLMACTSTLTATEERPGILHGRNFDFKPPWLADFPIIVKYVGQGAGPDYWNIGVIGYLPFFHGANDAGISVSINMSTPNGQKPGGTPMGWLLREILSKAKNLEDVRKIVNSRPNDNINWILTVGSANEQKGIVFDLKNNVKAETVTRPGTPQIVLNRPFGDGRHEGTELAREHLDLQENINWSNVRRWKAAQRFLKTSSLAEPEEVWRLLRNFDNPYGEDVFSWNAATIANSYTMYSLVFDLAADSITLASNRSYAPLREVWQFDLGTNRFAGIYLPAHPWTLSEEFLRREKVWTRLKKAFKDGKLTLEMIGAVDKEDFDPFVLDEFAHLLDYLDVENPEIATMLEYYVQEHDKCGYSLTVYALSIKNQEPQKALDLLEEVLARPDTDPFYELHLLEMMTDIAKEIKNDEKERGYAQRWLEVLHRLEEEYVANPSSYNSTKKKMLRIVSN